MAVIVQWAGFPTEAELRDEHNIYLNARYEPWDEAQAAKLEQRNRRGDPPESAEFLLTLFATTRHAEAVIGDLNERFGDECQKIGRSRAIRLYWARTLRSLWPLLRRAIGKALKWGAVISIVRRIFDHTAA
jgi:hypothetical protein